MATIDLTTPPPPARSFLDGLPRRLTLTLPELRLVAEHAGNAPLPFDLAAADQPAGGLSGRLGQTRESADAAAYAAALSTLHDPAETLRRRGLIIDDVADPGVVGAVGLLATPDLAIDIDVACGETQVKSWHRHADGAVATLSTCDGVVFELAWFPVGLWTDELARVTSVPEGVEVGPSVVPARLDAPYALMDAVGEALRSGRSDLVPVLLSNHPEVRADGSPQQDSAAGAAVTAVHTESVGRLRMLVAEVSDQETTTVGVVSWMLLRDGWHCVTPHHDDDGARVVVSAVRPGDLAAELAPVLAQVTS